MMMMVIPDDGQEFTQIVSKEAGEKTQNNGEDKNYDPSKDQVKVYAMTIGAAEATVV
jgi:hypothetical protein